MSTPDASRRGPELVRAVGFWGLVAMCINAVVGSGVFLELLNYFFLAKRQRVRRLSAELDEAQANSDELEQKIRESGRV